MKNKKNNVPICSVCLHMEVTGYAKVTGNNSHLKGPRGYCMCVHPDAFETFNRVCPRSSRLAAFIGYTPPGGSAPQIKTSPRWCPLRNRLVSSCQEAEK